MTSQCPCPSPHHGECPWVRDCLHYQGRVLTGKHGHYCADWDELPIDETCLEWPCPCDVGDRFRQASEPGCCLCGTKPADYADGDDKVYCRPCARGGSQGGPDLPPDVKETAEVTEVVPRRARAGAG